MRQSGFLTFEPAPAPTFSKRLQHIFSHESPPNRSTALHRKPHTERNRLDTVTNKETLESRMQGMPGEWNVQTNKCASPTKPCFTMHSNGTMFAFGDRKEPQNQSYTNKSSVGESVFFYGCFYLFFNVFSEPLCFFVDPKSMPCP